MIRSLAGPMVIAAVVVAVPSVGCDLVPHSVERHGVRGELAGRESELAGRDSELAGRDSEPAVADTLFAFHSAFWLNLHHFLYEQAVFSAGDSTRRMARGATPVSLDALSDGERSAWTAALGFYRDSVIGNDLLFNRRLGEVDRELGALGDAESVGGGLGWMELAPVLEDAAPVYRAHWWPAHDSANLAHIAALEPLVARFGDAIATELTAVMQVTWPSEPVRVDIVEYANWAGAYTRGDPIRIVVSSTEGRGDPLGNLETVFHESGHGMIGRTRGPVTEAAVRAFTEAGKEPPRSLWHPLLFYTVGEIVGDELAEAGIEGYEPYADRFGLYTGRWAQAHALVLVYWPPYMEGRTTLDASMDSLAAAW